MSDHKEMRWLHHVYMQAPVAIGIYIGEKHVVEFANPKMLSVWGRTAEQMLHTPLFEGLPEVSQQGFEEILAEVLHTGKPFSGNDLPATLHRSGKLDLAYFNIIYEPLRNDQGEIYGIIQTATEVTELVEARQKAERNEEILKAALEAGKMGSWHMDFVHDTMVKSIEYDRIFGYHKAQQEWNLAVILEHVLPEDRPLAKANFQQGLKNGVCICEVRIQWPDRSLHHIQVKGKTAYNLKGDPISMSGIIMDITEQKLAIEKERQLAAEQAARKEAERQGEALQVLFMDAPALICTLHGPDHTFELVNVLYQQLFYGRELQGKPIKEALPELEGQPIMDVLDKVYQTGEAFKGNEIPVHLDRFNTGKLELRHFNFVYQPRRNAEEEVMGILVFAYDITDRKKSEEELLRLTRELAVSNKEIQARVAELSHANEQLTRTNADLDNFIYTASHDLKAPISNIEGLVEALERTTTGDRLDVQMFQKIVGMIHSSINRFKRTIKELTDIAQIQKDVQETSQIIPADIIHEVIMDLQPLIRKSEAKVEINECTSLSFQFSHKNFKSIVYNLLSNAIKYSALDRTPVIKIRCYQQSGYQSLIIEDNGLGISEQDKQKIFLMFKRLHAHIEGSGVGLYLVKRIIDNAGGSIEVESEEGKGSKFSVHLPIK